MILVKRAFAFCGFSGIYYFNKNNLSIVILLRKKLSEFQYLNNTQIGLVLKYHFIVP